MNDDELKKLWQQQPLREPAPSAAQLISAMQKQTSQLRGIVDARDLRELAACASVIITFGCYAFFLHAHQPISRFGDWIVIAGSIFVAWKLIYTRRTTPPAPPGATIVEALRAELNSVRAQSRLLGSVLWWYLLPGFVGVLVMTWGGLPINDPVVMLLLIIPVNIMVTLFFIAVGVVIYRLNQVARARQLLPLEAQLEALLHSAETGEPLDETQVADPRPKALSMAAADQVKPIEFKVAFWQIALCGDIGIWIFLVDALTVGIKDWKTAEQDPEPFAPSVRDDEANRYSIVARKIVDLFNAGDFDGVQKLFNSQMSAALPPQKSSRFFTNLTSLYGRIEKCDGPTGKGYCGWIAFGLHCQRGELTMSLALDANDNVSGLHFQPTFWDLLNFKLIVPRLFSLLRLVLIMPFFLARSSYSWMLQTLTERAVGISTLGVHLHQGQCLILWDEIKEVRPLKVLSIRSLWLVRESGEKTIMPWTSLERHSDLKAAVEGFAPANHPMRRYLSLLRRT
jgi:hypothetical protein